MGRPLLVIDVEATCWKDNARTKQESEIIEFGAVLFDRDANQVRDEFQTFIKPVSNPTLSDFCTELTTIRQEDVEGAPVFPDGLGLLLEALCTQRTSLLASWGEYDRKQLQKDCRFHGVNFPFGKHHLNIKQLFAEHFRCRPCGMRAALELLRMPIEGTHHRGIDDARNIVRILQRIPL